MRVAIIGAGLQGICTAYYLARHGSEVLVLERNDGPALEASFGNGGYLQAECPEIWNAPGILRTLPKWWLASLGKGRQEAAMLLRTAELIRLLPWGLRFLRTAKPETFFAHIARNRELALYSLECLAELRQNLGLECAYRTCGALFLFRAPGGAEGHRPLLERLGAEWRLLGREELLEVEPALRPIGEALHQAILFPRDASADSHAFAQALALCAQELGVEFRYGQSVTDICADASGATVRCGAASLPADVLVIAAGAASKPLAAQVGARLPIAPAKGYSITVPLGDWRPWPRHAIADMDVHAGLNVLGGSLRVAGTAEFCGHDSAIDPERIGYMTRLLEAMLPEFAAGMNRRAIRPFAGLRPLSADGLPMIGRAGPPNAFVNSGHGGLGWTQAAGSAKALADAIVGIHGAFDLAPFSPGRF